MRNTTFFEKIRNGLIVSVYAANDYNTLFADENAMSALARSIARGGAAALRVNLDHIKRLKKEIDIPVIGIEKVYLNGEMRITPTMSEVEALVEAGADAIAIDATRRERFDNMTLEEFLNLIKKNYPVPVIGDISVFDEAIKGIECGLDAVGTTLAGYTSYGTYFGKLGDIPVADPDYDLIQQLNNTVSVPIIAEGRFNTPEKVVKAFTSGAHSVVVGTAISNPEKITEYFCHTITSSL